jgi:rhomboid protease GluP
MNMGDPPPAGYPPPAGVRREVQVQPPQGQPVVTYTLLIISILVYLLQLATQYLLAGTDLPALYGMKINPFIIQGQLWRLITPVFLHGSILHLAFNMYALLIFGPGLERYYGHVRYLALYFVAGFAGNVASFLFTDAPSLGSSTAIFGLLGAEAVFLYRNRELFGSRSQRALINLITIAVLNLFIGLSPGSGIDNWGHIGGLLGGTMFAWFAGPVLRVEGGYPYFSLSDQRQSSQAVLGGVGVFAVFAVLAALGIYLK